MDNTIKLFNDIVLNSQHNDKKILMDARFIENGVSKPVLLFIHGFKGFKDWGPFNQIADWFAAKGFVFVKINLSHNGTTPENPIDFVDLEAFGDNNFSIELDDINTAIDYLFSNQTVLPPSETSLQNFFMIGHSRGGALTILKANEEPRIKGIATWAAVHDLKKRWAPEIIEQWKKDGVLQIYNGRTEQYMPLKYQLVEDTLTNYERLDIPGAVKNMKTPQLIIHGTNDETVAVDAAKEMAQWNSNAELLIVEGANHTFGSGHPFEEKEFPTHTQEILNKTLSFFNSLSS